jgi:hypothetical protein
MDMQDVYISPTKSVDVQGEPLSTTRNIDMQGVYISTTRSVDVQGVPLTTTRIMDMQGVSLSTTSSKNVQDVSQSIVCSVDVQGGMFYINVEMPDFPASDQSGTEMNKITVAGTGPVLLLKDPVQYQIAPAPD